MGEGAKQELAAIAAVVLFLVSLVTLATIAVIYNSFNISMLERIRQFGVMRSIGATPKQIRRIVFIEAAIQSVIAIPLGLFAGILAMHTVFHILSQAVYSTFGNLTVTVSPLVLLVSAIVGFLAVFLSAFVPAIGAGRKQPLEAIFHRPKHKRKKFKKRKGFILGKLFSWEISLAFKNLQRNKKRSIITAFSLSISVILFIVFSVFCYYVLEIESTRTYLTEDFRLVSNVTQELYTEQDYIDILNLPRVESVYPRMEYRWSAKLLVSPEDINSEYSRLVEHEDIDSMDVRILGYNQDLISKAKQELIDGKANYSELKRRRWGAASTK